MGMICASTGWLVDAIPSTASAIPGISGVRIFRLRLKTKCHIWHSDKSPLDSLYGAQKKGKEFSGAFFGVKR